MQKVKLIGEISKFGSTWETECANIRDIFKLIECQTPGFRQHLLDAADAGIGYEIKSFNYQIGDENDDHDKHDNENSYTLTEEDEDSSKEIKQIINEQTK